MPEIIEINNKEVKRGEQKQINIKLARLPSFEAVNMSVYVLRAQKDGPVLLLTAGMHGDEINGVEIIRRLIEQERIMPQIGTVIAIPLINIFGFMHRERNMPDDKDVNRSFPGNKNGSLARLTAYTLMNQILPPIDAGIDFHSGGRARANFPQVRCKLDIDENRELAEAFSPPVIMNSTFIDHSFRQAAHKKGKPIIVFESGEADRFYEKGIQEGMSGTLRTMNYLGMQDNSTKENDTLIYKKSNWIRAKTSGIFHTEIELGQMITKKERIGFISDPYGREKTNIKSTKTGPVVGINQAPVVHKGDALVHVAYNEV